MAVSMDHVAIPARDPAAARFLGDLLALEVQREGPEGEFQSLRLRGNVSLIFSPAPAEVSPHHLAFRVAEDEFEALLLRLRARNIPFGNDPEEPANGRSEDPHGGRGRVYFVDPEGHLFEVCS